MGLMGTLFRGVLLLAFIGGVAVVSAQAPAADPDGTDQFEIASIKPTRFDRPMDTAEESMWKFGRGSYGSGRGRFFAQQMPAIGLIQMAYNVWGHQIQGAPAWARSVRYEIDLRAGAGMSIEQMRPMLRRLLADRFNLRLRQEKRAMTVLELVRSEGGLKISPMKDGECFTLKPGAPLPPPSPPPAPMPAICGRGWNVVVSTTPRVSQIGGVDVPMSHLVEWLEPEVGRVIVDRTGFTERFIYRVTFAPVSLDAGGAGVAGDPAGAEPIEHALREQLGLELKSTQGAVDVAVIERIERPTPN